MKSRICRWLSSNDLRRLRLIEVGRIIHQKARVPGELVNNSVFLAASVSAVATSGKKSVVKKSWAGPFVRLGSNLVGASTSSRLTQRHRGTETQRGSANILLVPKSSNVLPRCQRAVAAGWSLRSRVKRRVDYTRWFLKFGI